jgi:hypothetical protein
MTVTLASHDTRPPSDSVSVPWKWIWPIVGAGPITQGLDSEMFDRVDYPYSETFVREAIQNTLDARLDPARPAIISFRFHRAGLAAVRPFLQGAVDFRDRAGFQIPDEWRQGSIDWLTIEDFNAKGLGGDLNRRMSDFWNYWLNFGVSNKDGSGRGGRGIGRVTFLIASRIQTVIGLTRRSSDSRTVACGMCVLKLFEDGAHFRTTHAYLAGEEDSRNSIFVPHGSEEFHRGLEHAFGFKSYRQPPDTSGLALAIPYPHPELTPEGILASSIEHFAPAIMNRSLIVRVNDEQLDERSISDIAERVADHIHAEAIREDVPRYLGMIERGLSGELADVTVTSLGSGLKGIREQKPAAELQAAVEAGETVAIRIRLPLERRGQTGTVSLKAVVARTPAGQAPIDRLYREGMSLPDVKAKNAGDLDAIIVVDDPALATYLNFCEGKAHLDLLESTDVRTKLREQGYNTNFAVKRFVKNLPVELRNYLTPEITEPDANVFDTWFSVPSDDPGKKAGKGPKPKEPPPKPDDPPEPKTPALIVDTLPDGFRVRANPKFADWPVNFTMTVAYADGSRKPAWTPFDFSPSGLRTVHHGCEITFVNNRIEGTGCNAEFSVEVTGFDANRELDTRIRAWKDA